MDTRECSCGRNHYDVISYFGRTWYNGKNKICFIFTRGVPMKSKKKVVKKIIIISTSLLVIIALGVVVFGANGKYRISLQ